MSAPNFTGWQHIYSGKVRDLYEPADGSGSHLLVVASDRISAFDHVLEPSITGKGALLTALSNWWFDQIDVPNHFDADGPQAPPEIADRSMVTRRLEMYPIECVVRGALTGSGYAEYVASGSVCGIELPAGLQDGDVLESPIYTPAYKAPQGEHDENITYEQSAEIVGDEIAAQLRETSLNIFTQAREIAAQRGVILADTKFEFGRDPHTGTLTLADEVLTSDSSRYWDAEVYATAAAPAERISSFDKQIVRNWLNANWNKQGDPPVLPQEIVDRTLARYAELYTRITGLNAPRPRNR